jgi:hypothetical protein
MVVGGCEGGVRADGEADNVSACGTWKEGGVASGRVVNLIPAETAENLSTRDASLEW